MKCVTNKTIVIISLHASPLLPAGAGEAGGANSYARELLVELSSKDINTILITRKKNTHQLFKQVISSNITIYNIELGDISFEDKDIIQHYHQNAFDQVESILLTIGLENIILHSIYWHSGNIARQLKKKYLIPFVHSIMSNGKRKSLQNSSNRSVQGRIEIEAQIFSEADKLICSSLSERNDMAELYKVPYSRLLLTGRHISDAYKSPDYLKNGSSKIHSLVNGEPSKYYQLNKIQLEKDFEAGITNETSFIYFGRLHVDKGILIIIRSWLELYKDYGDEMPNLWIVGGVPDQIHEIRSIIKSEINEDFNKAEKRKKIIWWGHLSAQGISTLLLKSKAYIMHSKYEAGGRTVMEALSHGVPVIATPFGYANDYIHEGINGFIVPFNDHLLLMHKMSYFVDQVYLSALMGENARSMANHTINEWQFIDQHLYAYGLAQKATPKENELHVTNQYLNSYPFCVSTYTYESLTTLLKCLINESVINYHKNSNRYYEIYEIKTHDGEYYLKRFRDVINLRRSWLKKGDMIFPSSSFIVKVQLFDSRSFPWILEPIYIGDDEKIVLYPKLDSSSFVDKNTALMRFLESMYFNSINEINNHSFKYKHIVSDVKTIQNSIDIILTGLDIYKRSYRSKNQMLQKIEHSISLIQRLSVYELEFSAGLSISKYDERMFCTTNNEIKFISPEWLVLRSYGYSQSIMALHQVFESNDPTLLHVILGKTKEHIMIALWLYCNLCERILDDLFLHGETIDTLKHTLLDILINQLYLNTKI